MKNKGINKNIAFLGSGKMAEALISGFIKSRLAPASAITAVDIDLKRLSFLKRKYRIKTSTDKLSALKKANIIFLAVKPRQMEGLLCEAGLRIRKNQLVISIAAGITTKWIERFLIKGVPVVRTMPNTPAAFGCGATGIAKGRWAKAAHLSTAKKLFDQTGITAALPESKIDAVTAVSGSGPAYVFLLAELLEQAAKDLGLAGNTARDFSRQTVIGAGEMLKRCPETPAARLRKNVTSPGGTTEAAIKTLARNKFAEIFKKAVKRAKERAKELSR
ncbi:MAG: pyrroline-5-carboxylate reductase [Elusimicrobiota bacterium]